MNRLVLFLFLFGVFAHDAFARTSGRERNVRPSQRVQRPDIKPLFNGGLQSSLTASGYRFTINPPLPNVRSSLRMARPSFSATASVLNQSSSQVPFAFADQETSLRPWNFRLYDGEGDLVWESEPAGGNPGGNEPVTVRLRPGRSLSRTVGIPLWLDEGPLAPGRYTVEAVLLSEVPLVVTTLILVLPPKVPFPPKDTGTVKGTVFFPERDPETGQMRPAGGMSIRISVLQTEVIPNAGNAPEVLQTSPPIILPPYPKLVWSGTTGNDGTFSAELPAGEYVVDVSPAYTILIYPPPPMPSGRAQVTVTSGETTETTIVLSVPKLVVDPAPN